MHGDESLPCVIRHGACFVVRPSGISARSACKHSSRYGPSSVSVRVLQAHLTIRRTTLITRARPLSALRRGLLVAAALLTIPVAGLYAQTTGRLFGQLTDAQGAALPGVTVTVSSPALQGTQTQVTDGEGNYRFPSLPPGHYTVKAELAELQDDRTAGRHRPRLHGYLESQDVAGRRHRIGHGPGDVADGRHDLDDHGRQRRRPTCSTSFPCAATSTR